MSYEVLARKYRPRRFEEVTGQEAITRVLRGAIQQRRLGHAFLFTGPRGVGKTSTARILAACLNCLAAAEATTEPCGQCEVCRDIAAGVDVDVVEIDGASNRKIDDVRALREQVGYAPMRSRYKVYILDEVHQLTSEAFNALLKTLEEPPRHVKFIFATTEVEKVPETIRSRCQIHEFHRIGEESIVERLRQVCAAEGRTVPDEVLAAVARGVSGGMRDAQTLLDQLLAMSPEAPTLEDLARLSGRAGSEGALRTLAAVQRGDAAQLLVDLGAALDRGRREEDLLDELVEGLRDLMLLAVLGSGTEHVALEASAREPWSELLSALGRSESEPLEWIDAGLSILLRARNDLRRAAGAGRLVLELALLRFARVRQLSSLDSILRRLESGSLATSAPAAPPRSDARPPVRDPGLDRRVAPSSAAPAAARSRSAAQPAPNAAATPPRAPVVDDEGEAFERFLGELAKRDRGLHELASSRMAPLRWDGTSLVLGLGGADFTEIALVGDPSNRRLLDEAVRSALGEAARLVLDDGSTPAKTAPRAGTATAPPQRPDPGEPQPTPSKRGRARQEPHPAVERAKELLDGEEVD